MNRLILLVAALLLTIPFTPNLSAGFEDGRLDYTVQFNGKRVDWHSFAFFVMPGEITPLRVLGQPDAEVTVTATGGELSLIGDRRWQWQAPDEPGLYPITIQPADGRPMTLNVLTKVPSSEVEDGWLGEYRIGEYPVKPLRGNPIYLPPPGKIEVWPEMMELPVSPNFTLGQFLCKQQPDHWPKYLVLREALVAKLEIILAEVNRRGIHTDSFVIMSGHRTPWYNQAIGNGRFSRHVWGGAADIFIDTNGDGRMDDLNGDGRIDMRDAQILLDIIEDLYETRKHQRLHGGLGLYGPRPHRGPFVHVDARGHEARWTVP
ncbi:MAG: hypothetical protein JJU31_14810 [Wenzhouxiangella sp.]|nr:hypothetical protein [Wenzhouxiangella sp.]